MNERFCPGSSCRIRALAGAQTVPVAPRLPHGEAAGFGQQSSAAETLGEEKKNTKEESFFGSEGLELNRIPLSEVFCLVLSTSAQRRRWLMPRAVTSQPSSLLATVTELPGAGIFCHHRSTKKHGGWEAGTPDSRRLCAGRITCTLFCMVAAEQTHRLQKRAAKLNPDCPQGLQTEGRENRAG